MDNEDGAVTKSYLWYNLFPNNHSYYFPTFYCVPIMVFLPMFSNSSSGCGTYLVLCVL
jgi:hypothetical protein